jgi:hypothetical protein
VRIIVRRILGSYDFTNPHLRHKTILASAERVLRRYVDGRRDYDASDNHYPPLEGTRKLIATEERVRIFHDEPGENITRSILLQAPRTGSLKRRCAPLPEGLTRGHILKGKQR